MYAQSPSLFPAFHRLLGTIHFFRFVKKPTDTEGIFRMATSLQKGEKPEVVNAILAPVMADPVFRKAYEDKYWPELPSFSELKNYPEGSFGKEASNFFKQYNLDPDLFPAPDFSSVPSYLTSRFYQAHDFWHVLTGYDTSLKSELALQAFGLGQYQLPTNLTIIAGGLMHLLQNNPAEAVDSLDIISRGLERGRKAKHLLRERVLERLMDPIDEVRRDLNIT